MPFALMLSALLIGVATSARAQVVSQAPENFVLTGVIVYEGGGGLAWVQEPTYTANQVRAVRPGDTVGPYRLVRILDDRVDFEGPKGPLSIPLQGGHAGSGTAIATPMPVAPTPTASTRTPATPPAPAVASAPQPSVAPRSANVDLNAFRQRLEAARQQQGMQRRAVEANQPSDPAAAGTPAANNRGSMGPAAATVGAAPNNQAPVEPGSSVPQFANPDVLYFPVGDPRRRQGFGSLIGRE